MANIIRWGVTDGMRLAKTVGKELQNPANYTLEEFITAAECALEKYPDEWVIYYSLGDKYQQLGYYAEGLRVTQKCVKLRPKDIRSVYALATSYNMLTRSAWSEDEKKAAQVLQLLIKNTDKFDEKYSQAGLDRTGLAIETAAVQAIRWFERALTLGPDRESLAQIKMDLATLYKRFPHLKR